MFNQRNVSIASNQSIQLPKASTSDMGTVYHVVLDVDDAILDKLEIDESIKPLFIGAIQVRSSTQTTQSDEYLPLALPYNQSYKSLPLKNEVVKIINPSGGGLFYERIVKSSTPNVSNEADTISGAKILDKSKTQTSSDYSRVQKTGISRSTVDISANYDGYGDYFEENDNIKYLRLYEGDTLIESRFGQSIRFSGYNNPQNLFSPTVIIRNGENPQTLNGGNGISTEEDINTDGNIIFLGSGERLLEYTLPVKNRKESFFNYPNELKGNQILLNSDRIILSAKTSEMIFASRKDTGFITDGQFSIDATRGINITTDDNIFIETKNRDFNINIGSGTIALGTDGELEAAAKGETLVSILGELLDLIVQQIYLTPAGPTSPGPTNIAQFSTLKLKLNSMLSNNVQLK
jgi:hypothetical protein